MRSNVGCGCHKVHCKFIILEKEFTKIHIQINTLHTVKWIVLHLMACIWTVSKYIPHKDHLWTEPYFVPHKHAVFSLIGELLLEPGEAVTEHLGTLLHGPDSLIPHHSGRLRTLCQKTHISISKTYCWIISKFFYIIPVHVYNVRASSCLWH